MANFPFTETTSDSMTLSEFPPTLAPMSNYGTFLLFLGVFPKLSVFVTFLPQLFFLR